MPNRKKIYYVGDDVTFKGVWKIEGVEQTPDTDSGTVVIKQYDNNSSTIVSTTATIVGNQIQYKYSSLVVGTFAVFFTASFASGADKRTGVIEFIVKKKESH